MECSASRRGVLGMALAGIGSLVYPSLGRASTYPVKPVRILCGSSAGGALDVYARLFADGIGPHLSQSFVVENRPGSSGMLAADGLARSAADGYTLLAAAAGSISALPHLYNKLTFTPADFVSVVMLSSSPYLLVVPASLPVRSVQELIALAKAKPGTLNFGSSGNGSMAHLCSEYFCNRAGVKITHVPYKGDSPALNDLVSGTLQVLFASALVAMPQVKAGKLRVLAVTTRERARALPEIPTLHESGLRDFEYVTWSAIFAPPGTPRPVVDALASAWSQARNLPAVRTKQEEFGSLPPDGLVSGPPLAEWIKADSVRQGQIIRTANIRLD